MKKEKRESIAKAHNVTSAIKKKLSENDQQGVDLTKIAAELADRREKLS